jgi:ribonuclease P protein component
VSRHFCLDFLCVPTTKQFGRILVITPRHIGKANKRNLIRRRIKSIFYEEKLFEKNLDCVVIAKKAGLELPFVKLKELVNYVYSKTKKSH